MPPPIAARRLAASIGYVGVLCVEFFLLDDGALVANEMAPRPHNSGHYSIDACDVSQFELQVRTMTGAPLVTPRLHSPALMLNLLGDLWFVAGDGPIEPDWARVLALPGVHLHLYGKTDARPRPQDGPPDGDRRERGGGRRGGPRGGLGARHREPGDACVSMGTIRPRSRALQSALPPVSWSRSRPRPCTDSARVPMTMQPSRRSSPPRAVRAAIR